MTETTKSRDRSPTGKPKDDKYRERPVIKKDSKDEPNEIKAEDSEERGRITTIEEDPTQIEMLKLMGFSGFGTTKEKKVAGTNVYGASRNKKSEYRQYMNREKGFNRSLSPTPEEKKLKRKAKKPDTTK